MALNGLEGAKQNLEDAEVMKDEEPQGVAEAQKLYKRKEEVHATVDLKLSACKEGLEDWITYCKYRKTIDEINQRLKDNDQVVSIYESEMEEAEDRIDRNRIDAIKSKKEKDEREIKKLEDQRKRRKAIKN